MKEGAAAGGSGNGGNGSGSLISRSAVEKERTKMRERQRRSITTKIFNGLRKHGGYRLSPRADINQVLRELAKEAGWVVEPDGTTYRSSSPSSLSLLSSTTITPPRPPNVYKTTDTPFYLLILFLHASSYVCQACGSGVIKSGTSTPTSSFIGGECSANASPANAIPMNAAAADPVLNYGVYCSNISSSAAGGGGSVVAQDMNTRLAMYMMYGRLPSGAYPPEGVLTSSPLYHQQQQMYISHVASNHNTPAGSPHRRS